MGTSRAEVPNLAIKKESFIDDFSSIMSTDKILPLQNTIKIKEQRKKIKLPVIIEKVSPRCFAYEIQKTGNGSSKCYC